MSTPVYVIRRAFVLPLALVLLLCAVLLGVSLVQGQPIAKAIILGGLMLPLLLLLIESIVRRLTLTDEALVARKLLGEKTLKFAEVTAVETVRMRKRTYLTVCADDEFVIISNSYGDFPGLVAELLARVPEAAVSPETRSMAENPPVKYGDIVSAWLGVGLLIYLLLAQFQ